MSSSDITSNGEVNKVALLSSTDWQDRWKNEYPEIDGRTAVLATLFNQEEIKPRK